MPQVDRENRRNYNQVGLRAKKLANHGRVGFTRNKKSSFQTSAFRGNRALTEEAKYGATGASMNTDTPMLFVLSGQ